jgi:hypothetical protein
MAKSLRQLTDEGVAMWLDGVGRGRLDSVSSAMPTHR